MAVRVALVVIAAVVCLSVLVSLSALAYGLGNARLVTDTHALPAGMRSLTIETGDFPVALSLTTAADVTEPRVDLRTVTTEDTRLAVANDDDGSRVTLGDSGSGLLRFTRTGEIKVILPPGLARGLSVKVNHRTGSISTDADLDQLVVKTDTGAVALGGSARRVDISVRHGDISTITRIAVTESFRAETKSGSISVEFRAVPRTTEAIADGDVTVRVPAQVRIECAPKSSGLPARRWSPCRKPPTRAPPRCQPTRKAAT